MNAFEFKEIQIICKKYNLNFEYTSFETYDYGNSWTSLIKNNHKKEFKITDTIVIVIGRSAEILKEYIQAESNFDYFKAGQLLGYPICCIRAYSEIEVLKENWFQYYLSDNKKSYPFWANRINTIFGGGSFIGEMFPCSLNCENAINLGKNAAKTMESFGLIKLTDTIRSHCIAPIYLDQNNQLSKSITSNKIDFY